MLLSPSVSFQLIVLHTVAHQSLVKQICSQRDHWQIIYLKVCIYNTSSLVHLLIHTGCPNCDTTILKHGIFSTENVMCHKSTYLERENMSHCVDSKLTFSAGFLSMSSRSLRHLKTNISHKYGSHYFRITGCT